MSQASQSHQFVLFKDALARRILAQPDFTSSSSSSSDDPASVLDDFATFLATESWPILPPYLQELTYDSSRDSTNNIPDVESLPLDATPVSFSDTLVSYGISDDVESALIFLRKTIESYVADAAAPPPVWSSTRTKECEICEREVPLTYHHLIPRSAHSKVLKRKWHPESMLNSVAWICRPCHNVVHGVARCEELAQHYYTIELLLERDDIQKWRRYAMKQRFGVRRG